MISLKKNSVYKVFVDYLLRNFIVIIFLGINRFGAPKVLSIEDFAVYSAFLLYIGYAGMLHFGFIDGSLIINAGKDFFSIKSEINKEFFSLFFLTAITSFIFYIVLVLLKIPYAGLFALYTFLSLVKYYYEFILKSTKRFSISVTGELLNRGLLSLFLIFIFFTSSDIDATYIVIVLNIIMLVSVILYTIFYFNFLSIKGITFSDIYKTLKSRISLGIYILIGNIIVVYLTTLDKVFIQNFKTDEEFAIYIFPSAFLAIVNIFIMTASRFILPYLTGGDKKELNKKLSYYGEIVIVALGVVSLLIILYPAEYLLTNYLPDYVGSLIYIKYFFLAFICISIVNTVHVNLFQANRLKYKYILVNISSLIIFSLVYFILYYYDMDSIVYAKTSVFLTLFYFILNEIVLVREQLIPFNYKKLILLASTIISIMYII